MKLSRFDSVTRAEKGVEMELLDPITRQKTGAAITLLGADSASYKAKSKEIEERNRMKGRSISLEETTANAIEILAACTVGWRGLETEDGKEFPFSQANARLLYTQYPELYDRAGVFAMTRTNFFEPASET